ncbi:MAG: hypothetical protein ACFFAO_06040 [Candidatus Hermodarchaeota archaeon]
MNEVFFEFKENKSENDLNSEIKIEIILNFLSKVEEYIILYETRVDMCKLDDVKIKTHQDVINALQNIFNQVNPSIRLVKGKIREIYLSFSS